RCQGTWPSDLQLGTKGDDQLLGMTVDGEGNVVAAGFERGVVGVENIDPSGDSDAVVMKLRPAGTTIWKTGIDTSGSDTAEDVAIDPTTGDLVVVGRTSGAFPSFTNAGQFDLFLALLDADGNVATVFQAGNERPQHPARLALTAGGGVVVAGWDDTYTPTNFVAANQVGFVADFAIGPAPGHVVTSAPSPFQYLFPPSALPPFSLATDVAAELDGSARYVTSLVASNRQGPNGIFVAKTRADPSAGGPDWTARISPTAFDAVTAVALSPSGDLYVTGGTFNKLGAMTFGQEDAYVLRIDKATGALVWAAQMGGPESDYPTALAFDAAGNVYIAGITLGSAVDGVSNQGLADVFAMKLSDRGDLLSAWQVGTSADDEVTSLVVDPCGNVLVGGYTGGAFVPGQANVGGEDMFILRAKL
ncbi:MAG TPA: SBBP repeat-containing protein, partial [Polyangia bacterium]|nr:SBBP repeat-containing protein [Polyangia bacterium]